jgi:phosphoglycerol transferase MdoB-like AlkP superfamily enzyme
MPDTELTPSVRRAATRRTFWAAFWLAVALVAVKAYYLGVPGALEGTAGGNYLRSLAAISYVDVVFAAGVWAGARALLALAGQRPLISRTVSVVFVAFAAFATIYEVASVIFFGVFGGFLTYPLLALVGNVQMLSSSVAAHLTPRVILTLVGLPLIYAALVEATVRLVRPRSGPWRPRHGIAFGLLGAWLIFGLHGFSTKWATRQGWRIAENPHWVLLSSWWRVTSGDGTVRLPDQFPAADLTDFDPVGLRPPPSAPMPGQISRSRVRTVAVQRPPNVILVVLESVAARWAGLNGGPYDSTPTLKAESARALVADNFYAHAGRSSSALMAMLLSAYPKLGFRDVTEEYPQLPGTSLASMFRDRGYHTAFVTPSDLSWAEWGPFLKRRGFGEIRDYHQLACEPLSSWGVEDRCMVDGILDVITQAPERPFFVMGWTTQTHHPYEPTPGVPLLDMEREPVPDQYELDRYLNVLHETDRHLGRLFDTIRRLGLDQDTLIVVIGDHGQAFGYPHNTYIQGRTMYEEDVHVPLMFWFPRLYQSATRSNTVGGQVDLAPTIADLAGLPSAPDWQGRSLFDTTRAPRAYFYVAEDTFTLGLREGRWKYIFDLRDGVDELYDLDRDPNEQHNLAKAEPERSARMRQHLAAWTEANRRQYERADEPQRIPTLSAVHPY